MDFTAVQTNLEKRGFTVKRFSSAAQAADYLNGAIDVTSVGFGGSVTLEALGLYDRLSAHNEVHWHWKGGPEERTAARGAKVYLTSVNALAETGELVNIDGSGNRVSETLFGPERLYLAVGRNKLAPTLEAAIHRARNVAAPRNAKRLGVKTPCAEKGDRCYDCASPQRICRGLVIHWRPMNGMATEVLLIDEDLGL